MKKFYHLLVVLFVGMLFTACATTYSHYQLLSAKPSTKDILLTQSSFKYSNEDCIILYNFWKDYGDPGFAVYNNSNETLYIDLSKSFFVINDVAYDYFQNKTSYIYQHGVKVAAIAEKKIVAIPANSGKRFSEYSIKKNIHRECGFITYPTKESETFVYTKETSPVVFRNIICYRKDSGNYKTINNEFFISEIKNINGTLFAEYKVLETKCRGQKKEESVLIYNYKSPDKFYIPYVLGNSVNWVY